MYITGIDVTAVDSSAGQSLGALGGTTDANGTKIFVYGKGLASVAAGTAVTFDEAWQSALAAHTVYGLTGIAMAAVVASKFGWFQVYGYNAATSMLKACADNAQLYTSATAGSLDDTSTSQTIIAGAVARALTGSSTANGLVSLAWPTAHA